MLDPRAFLINSKTGRVVAATFIEFLSGNSTNPSICFTDSPDSGLQCDNAGAVNYVKNGTNLGELGTASSLIGGSDTQIQFNDNGSFGGSADLTWDDTGKELSVGGDLTAGSFIPTSSTVPTNGVYLPDTNSVALATNSTGRLFISNDGKVGIGVSDPSSYNINADDLVIADPNGFNSGIAINITDNNGSSNIWFGDSDAEGRGQFSYAHGATDSLDVRVGGNLNLTLYETGGLTHIGGGSSITPAVSFNGSAPADSLVIDSTGKVGLGTSTPGEKLTVEGGAIQLKGSTYTNFSDYWGNGDNEAMFMPYGYLGSNGAFAFSIYCNGYRNASSGFTYLGIDGNTSTACGIDLVPDGTIVFRTGTASGTVLPSRMTIDPSGFVGLSGNLNIPDKITHIGDSNTAIRFPANDQFSIETAGSERFRIDNLGRLFKGASSSISTYNTSAGVQIHATSTTNGASMSLARFNDDSGAAQLILGKSRNTAIAPGTIVQDGDSLGLIVFVGDDGTDLSNPAARIEVEVDGTPGTDDMPGRLVFSVTADGTNNPTEAMRIKNTKVINFSNAPVYADNAAAKSGGLVDGDVYRTSTGDLKIVYT